MTSHRCFLCNAKITRPVPPDARPQTTRASQANVVDLIEEFLGFPLDDDDYADDVVRLACDSCLERFNVYDDAVQTAKRAQAELTEIYMDVVCKRTKRERIASHNSNGSSNSGWARESSPITLDRQVEESAIAFAVNDGAPDEDEEHQRQPQTNPQIPVHLFRFRNKASQNVIVCKCRKEFKLNVGYWNHECAVKEPLWICDICNKTYKSKKALRLHLNTHSLANTYACPICGKVFTQRGALKRHRPLHTGEKPYQCDVCGKQFVHAATFRIHKADHDGNARKKECSVCGLKLLSNSHLERHMRVHSGDKPFACKVCGKHFAERYNMRSHMKKSHPEAKVTIDEEYEQQPSIIAT